MWEPCAPGRVRVPAVLAQLEAAAHGVGAARALLVVAREPGRGPQALGPPAASATSAGRTSRTKVTIAETGLPGSPKTRVSPRVPNQVGLPGFNATPQNDSSTPSSASARLTWSCSPTETPPQSTTTSESSAGAIAARVASRSSGAGPGDDHLRARPLGQGRDRVGVRVANAARAHLLAGLEQLVAAGEDADARAAAAGDGGRAERGEDAELRRAEPGALRRARSPPAGCPRRHGACRARPRPPSSDQDPAVLGAGRLDPDDGVGARRDGRAGRDPDRLPGRQRRGGRVSRPRLADHAQGDRRLGPRPAGVLGAHREAVHRGVVEGRHRLGGGRRPPPGTCREPRAGEPAPRRAAPPSPERRRAPARARSVSGAPPRHRGSRD